MTQTPSRHKSPPVIRYFQDGPGWSYTITLNGVPLLGAWCRGKRAVAERDAAYRLKEWQAAQAREAAA